MNKNSTPLGAPDYSSYTYDSPNFLVRFPHRKRNKLVAEAIAKENPQSWLDYGAGDGALLHNLAALQAIPSRVLLFEPDIQMRDQLIARVCSIGFNIELVTGDYKVALKNKYDLVTALEVLEHLPLPERIRFYSLLATTLNPRGKVLIEMPIEYGPILLLKEFGRKYLKRRRTEYSIRELISAVFGKIQDAHSRYAINDTRSFISPHRGFDLSKLLAELGRIGKVKEIVRSPFPLLPKAFNQAVLFSFELEAREPEKIKELILAYSG